MARRIWWYYSGDGRTWKLSTVGSPEGGEVQDATPVSLNPFRKLWVVGLKSNYLHWIRALRYLEFPVGNWDNPPYFTIQCEDVADQTYVAKYDMNVPAPGWVNALCLATGNKTVLPYFFTADADDPPFENDPAEQPRFARRLTDTYAMAQYAYESMMLGHALIHYGYNRQAPKKSDIHLAWSRDGFHYERLPAAERGRGLLDLASIPADQQKRWVVEVPQGAGVIVAPGPRTNQTLILHAGTADLSEWNGYRNSLKTSNGAVKHTASQWSLRRDGFASLNGPLATAASVHIGLVVTEPLVWHSGEYFFVNANTAGRQATVRVRVLDGDESGQELLGWSFPMAGVDSTQHEIRWETDNLVGVAATSTIKSLQGQTVTLEFEVGTGAALFSFWVSDWATGESGGWVGGGGPGMMDGHDVPTQGDAPKKPQPRMVLPCESTGLTGGYGVIHKDGDGRIYHYSPDTGAVQEDG